MRARRAMSGELGAARAGLARAAQPPPLRRLPRPRGRGDPVRRHRRVLELPARARRPAQRRARARAVGGYTRHLRAADLAASYAAGNGRLERIDFGAGMRVRASGKHVDDAAHRRAPTSRRSDPMLGPVVALLRGRGDERGRPARRAARATSGPAITPDTAGLQPIDRAGRQGLRRAGRQARRTAQRDAARWRGAGRAHRAATAQPAAGDVPRCSSRRWSRGSGSARSIVFARRADRALAARRAAVGRRASAAYAARRRARARASRVSVSDGPWTARRPRRAGRRRRGRGQRAAAAGPRRRAEDAERAERERARGRSGGQVPARSATPSSTTARASSPTRTGARSTARCAPRRSRSCAASTRSASAER